MEIHRASLPLILRAYWIHAWAMDGKRSQTILPKGSKRWFNGDESHGFDVSIQSLHLSLTSDPSSLQLSCTKQKGFAFQLSRDSFAVCFREGPGTFF